MSLNVSVVVFMDGETSIEKPNVNLLSFLASRAKKAHYRCVSNPNDHMRVAVTGAFGYSGRYIASRLLNTGHSVLTLTNSLNRPNPFGQKVPACPLQFHQLGRLAESLRGSDALINTYWVRFNHRLFSHSQAVANTKILFQAAKDAGVKRIVHVSITNPDLRSELSYFRGKAELEAALTSLGVSCCILRPAVLFGKEDVLIQQHRLVPAPLPGFRRLRQWTL
jgi:NADH dehydrogenase